MSSDESDLTPESIKLDALGIVNNLLPEKSKEKYLKAYDDFHKWKTAKGAKSVSEDVLPQKHHVLSEMALSEKEVAANEAGHQHHYGYRKDFRTALPQIIAVSVKNLLLLGYGMTLGFTTILIPAVSSQRSNETNIDEPLHLQSSEISWISSINYIVVPLGCAVSGVVTTPMGRRRAMQMVNVPFFISWLIFHFSSVTGHLYGALILTGVAGGLLEAPVLTYVAEITQPHLRGALSATSSMSIIVGVFTQFLFGQFLYWRTVALVNIIFPVLAVIMLCFVPESPHWLVARKRHEEARKSLQWLRGWTDAHAVEEELIDIQTLFKRKQVEMTEVKETISEKLSYYKERSFLVPYFLVSYAFFVGHFSGMSTLQTYSVSIFERLEAPIDKYSATLILGLLQIFGSGACVVLVHYTGKRVLTFFSTGGGAICCLMVAVYDAYIKTHYPNPTIPTVFMMLLALITHTGIRLLPWILIGEVFSAKTRSSAAGLSSAIGYVFGFLTNKMYISMVEQISIWGTYGFYGIVCLSGCVVFYFILPETEGKKLRDIENHFAGVRRLTNEVYKSKKQKSEISKMEDLKGATNPTFEDDNTKV